MTLRIAFLGTSEFAVPSLQACIAHHEVAVVVTQPDKPGNRGKPAPRPIADIALASSIPVLQPRRIRDQGAVAAILDYNIDALVVASYGQIIPAALLDAPRFGGINVHGSLLPRWRGAAPVAAAILAGDGSTGVAIMAMDAGLDTGAVYAQSQRPIPQDATTPALLDALATDGAKLLMEVMGQVEAGADTATPQGEDGVTYAPRLKREDGDVAWARDDAVHVDRMVRALNPWPGVSAPLAGGTVRLLRGHVAGGGNPDWPTAAVPGSVLASDRQTVTVATAYGAFVVEECQLAGKRPMAAADYLRGRRP